MRTFTYSDERSHKFWNIELKGNSFTVTYGRQGTAGQAQTKTFADADAAQREHDKLVKEKLAKGYVETTPTAKPAGSLRDALEAALADNPDDLAAHMAYADYLQEQGDPRGEFIQVQRALEDPARSAKERKTLQQREAKLLAAHQAEWLGDFARQLVPQGKKKRPYGDPDIRIAFRRGWLDTVEATHYTLEFTRALAWAPQARLLRCLYLNEDFYEEPGTYEVGDDPIPRGTYCPALYGLLRSPNLGNVRVLRFGEAVDDDEHYFNSRLDGKLALPLIKKMPKLEELYLLAQGVDTDQLFGLRTLASLRVLQVYHMDHYPLAKLAKNSAFANLTHLLCHPHCMREDEPYMRLAQLRAVCRSTTLPKLTHLRLRMSDFGDKACQEIVSSGILRRLKVLDLRNGCITDAGAHILADCPDLKNLELLDLDRNSLTAAGIRVLKQTGVKVVAREQWQPTGDEYADREYLFEGDGE
jgi:uncharacterized protein (TIGR02996 family)